MCFFTKLYSQSNDKLPINHPNGNFLLSLDNGIFELIGYNSNSMNTYYGEYIFIGDSLFLFSKENYFSYSYSYKTSNNIDFLGDYIGLATTFLWYPRNSDETIIHYDSLYYFIDNKTVKIATNDEIHEIMIERPEKEVFQVSVYAPFGKVFSCNVKLLEESNCIDFQVILKLNIEDFLIDLQEVFQKPIIIEGQSYSIIWNDSFMSR